MPVWPTGAGPSCATACPACTGWWSLGRCLRHARQPTMDFFLSRWEIGPDVDVELLEDLGWERLGDEERRELLTRFAHMLVDYMRAHSTAESLVRAYAAGEYRGSFIRKELKKAFNRETERLGLENKGMHREPSHESTSTLPDGT